MLGRAAPLGSDKKRQFEYNENPASAGFLLSGDTTGVFARCIASVPLSHRRRAITTIHKPQHSLGLFNFTGELCSSHIFLTRA